MVIIIISLCVLFDPGGAIGNGQQALQGEHVIDMPTEKEPMVSSSLHYLNSLTRRGKLQSSPLSIRARIDRNYLCPCSVIMYSLFKSEANHVFC